MEIYNDDCFNVFPKIKDKSIDLFILDLPYGQTACKWDSEIDLEKMWKAIKRIMKPSAVIVFFCTAKFGYTLIHSNPKWFRYDLIWEKSRKVGFLSANKMPLRKHELMYVFSKDNNEDNEDLINYSKKVLEYIGETKAEIKRKIKDADHFFRYSKNNFSLPSKETYDKLIELYEINKMEGFVEYKDLNNIFNLEATYNSQKTEGKPYKTKGGEIESYYREEGVKYKLKGIENKGERHPHSILQFAEDHENIYIFKKEGGTYNPQKTEGKPYNKTNTGNQFKSGAYGDIDRATFREGEQNRAINKGERHPHSILQFAEDHENIYIFKKEGGTYNAQKIKLEKPDKRNRKNEPENSESAYGNVNLKLKKTEYSDRHPTSVLQFTEDHENIYIFKKEGGTYNPQLEEGKPYHVKKEGDLKGYYREGEKNFKRSTKENKGTRHPTTILKFNNPSKSLHRTQKPTDLLEWLIRSYSNEGDTIMDFTMGSGSTGIACMNTKRKFIGIEMNKDIFTIAKNRFREKINCEESEKEI